MDDAPLQKRPRQGGGEETETTGKNAYLRAAGLGSDFFRAHPHVAVVSASRCLDNRNFYAVPESAIHQARECGKTYLYVMEPDPNLPDKFAPVGGVPLSEDDASASWRAVTGLEGSTRFRRIHYAYLKLDHYYNPATHAAERRTPQLAERQLFLPNYDLYLEDDGGETNARRAVPGIAPTQLIERRYALLKAFSGRGRWHACTSQKKNERSRFHERECAMREILFEGYESAEDRAEIDALSHRLLRAYALSLFSPAEDEACRRWLAQREEAVLRFRLETQCPNERDVVALVQRNAGTGLCVQPARELDPQMVTECERLFRDAHPDSDLPTMWFLVSATRCLELELSSLSNLRTVVEGGLCYLSYLDLQLDYLPRALHQRIVTAACRSVSLQGNDDDGARKAGEQVAKDLRQRLSPPKTSTTLGLPPIEECAGTGGAFPLCNALLAKRLRSKKHLHFHERKHHASFLMDCGWSKRDVEAYLRRRFLEGGTNSAVFESKYAQVCRRSEVKNGHSLWKDGARTIPYGYGCRRLTTEKALPWDERNRVGCPFTRMPSRDLERALRGCGGLSKDSEIKDVLRLAEAGDPRAACAACLVTTGGDRTRRLGAPQDFFRRARTSNPRKRAS